MAKTAIINGQRWRVERRKLRGDYGTCCHFTREIAIESRLSYIEALGTAIHEALHAVYPDKTEEYICKGEHAIMATLRAAEIITDGDGD